MSKSDTDIFMEQLAKRRAPAVAEAVQLIAQDRLADAESVVRQVDDSIYGAVELSKLFTTRLQELVASGETKRDIARVLRVYERALHWSTSAFPEPHTEYEAESNEAGRTEAQAHLQNILGFDPYRMQPASPVESQPAGGHKRMSIGLTILAILAMAASVLVGLTAITLLLAGGANSSEAQITTLKRMMLGVGLLCIGSLAGAIVALVQGRPGLASTVGIAPAVIILITLAVLIAIGA
jgi:hypothetical protein